MQTYKYQFLAEGFLFGANAEKDFKDILERNLKEGSSCLASYAMFETDSDILDHVSFDLDDTSGQLKAINLHTYIQGYAGCEADIDDCMRKNIIMSEEEFNESHSDDTVHVSKIDTVNTIDKEGEFPKTLYHIAERDYVNIITKEGIDPEDGDYKYMTDHSAVYLCEKKDLAAWLSVLKHNEDPIIMEVNTEGLGIEMSRMRNDRDYIPNGYGEYRTYNMIPASSIKEAELSPQFCAEIHADMCELSTRASKYDEMQEVTTGMQRLNDMGILKNATVEARSKVATERGNIPEVGMDEEDAVAKDQAAGLLSDDIDDFTKAVSEIPVAANSINM